MADDQNIFGKELRGLRKGLGYTQNQLAESFQPTIITIGLEEDVAIREMIKQAIGVDLWK